MIGYLNDLWVYNLTSGWWTWLSGANIVDQTAVYGIKGQPSVNNRPGGRDGHCLAMPKFGKKLYLFGGNGRGPTASGMIYAH